MTTLSKEEAERLAELEADLAVPAGPAPGAAVRPERFSDTALGMDDEGNLFPAPPLDEPESPAPKR